MKSTTFTTLKPAWSRTAAAFLRRLARVGEGTRSAAGLTPALVLVLLGAFSSASIHAVPPAGAPPDCCSNCQPPYPLSYTVAVQPGDNFLVNHLCHGTDNLLVDVLPVVPDGSQVLFWDVASQSFSSVATYFDGLGWFHPGIDPSTLTLQPGVGFVLDNPGGVFNLTFEGCEPQCPPPCAPTNGCQLVGRIGIGTSSYADLFTCPPPCGTQIKVWNPATQTYTDYDYVNGVWTPPESPLAIGQSAFVCLIENPDCVECVPPMITIQPQDQTVSECDCVTFSVTATGDPAPAYQWQRDNQDIPGATASSYTLCPVSLADAGSVFRVIIRNACGEVASVNAALTVTADVTPPHVVSVSYSCWDDRLYVLFDGPLDLTSATEVFNYGFASGATINDATLLADGRTVCLGTQMLTPGQTEILTVTGVLDCSGNPLSPDPTEVPFSVPVVTKGYILRQWWFNLPGTMVSDLTSVPAYPLSPDRECYTNLFELNSTDETDSYGARIHGWYCPPVSGDFRFYLASDDQAELWLSFDASLANAALIAREPLFANRREWTGTAGGSRPNMDNISQPIPMVAGQRYYIAAIMKEGGGSDHVAVAVQLPGAPVPPNGSTPIPGDQLAVCLPNTGAVTITKQPADVVVSDCCTNACFMVSAEGGGDCGLGLTYQWLVNGTPVPGATGTMFCIDAPAQTGNGAIIQVLVSGAGAQVLSDGAVLTVIPDVDPPAILFSSVDCLSNKITLVFTECLDPAQVADPFNFSISDGVMVDSVVLSPDGRTVCLFTTPMSTVTDYTVEILNQLDHCGNQADLLIVTVRCPCELPMCALEDVWLYEESGTDLGTPWSHPGYNDSSWPQGPGLLGFETVPTVPPIQTTLNVSPNKITFYFRKHFQFAGNPAGVQLRFTTRIDDGAVFYLNGAEIQRVRMPASPSPISYSTLATQAAPEPGTDVFLINATSLLVGANLLAVEVHQITANSSDILFGAAFTALVPGSPPAITSQPQDVTLLNCGGIASFDVTATGAPLTYQWQKSSDGGSTFNNIAGATGPTLLWGPAGPADNGCRFQVVVCNDCGCVTSDAAVLTVLDQSPPDLECSTNRVVRSADPAGIAVSYEVTATDDCDPSPQILCLPPPGSVFPCGTNTVLCVATDSSGNSTNCSFEVTVLCECLGLSNEAITCAPGAPGRINYSFTMRNDTGVPVKYLLLVPKTNCFAFSPDLVTFKPLLQPGQSASISTVIDVSGSCPSNLCFFVVALDSSAAECCSIMRCLDPAAAALQLVSAVPDCLSNKITVTFSAPLDPGSFLNVPNFIVDDLHLGISLVLSSASFGADLRTVCLFTSGPLNAGTPYRLTVNNVADACGNVIAAGSQTTFCCPDADPRLTWTRINGQLCLMWPCNAVLECVESLKPPIDWQPAPDQTNPRYFIPGAAQQKMKFFRLSAP